MKSLRRSARPAINGLLEDRWPMYAFVCKRCARSIVSDASKGTQRAKPLSSQPTRSDCALPNVSRRFQHITSVPAEEEQPEDALLGSRPTATTLSEEIIHSLDAEGRRQGSSKPSPSKIREKLKAWEREQKEQAISEGFRQKLEDFHIPYDTNYLSLQGDWTYAGEKDEDFPILRRFDVAENDLPDTPNMIGGRLEYGVGDLVSLSTKLASDVFEDIQVFCQKRGTQFHFYDARGRFRVVDQRMGISVFEPVRNIIDPKLIERMLPYLPQEELVYVDDNKNGTIPRTIAQPVHEILSKFSRAALKFYQDHRQVLANIYDSLAHEKYRRYMTFDEICREVVGKSEDELTPPERYAVHVAVEVDFAIKPMRSPRASQSEYAIRPAVAVRRLRKVVDWARLYQEAAAKSLKKSDRFDPAPHNPLYPFIEKARRLILESRASRNPTTMASLGPSLHPPPEGVIEETLESFSDADQMILELLFVCFVELPPARNSSLNSLGALIVRAIGAYPKMDLNLDAGYLLLQELGILPPWINTRLYSWEVNLPGTGGDLLTEELYRDCLSSDYQIGLGKKIDHMAGVRKDWGTMPVFCVDSESTTEIDDGFSVESVPGSEDLKWIHVHIADPAAFIGPKDKLGQYARRVLSTTYTGEHNVRMLPVSLVDSRLSLGPNRPAMTVSSLMRSDGTLMDVQITSSVIHNVVRLTHKQLKEELSPTKEEEQEESFIVGKAITPKQKSNRDNDWTKYIVDIQTIRDFLAPHLEQKRHKPDFLYSTRALHQGLSHLNVSVENAPFVTFDLSCCRRWKGDPTIKLKLNKEATANKQLSEYSTVEVVSADLVSEVMQVAGEAAARWCKARNVPIIYVGTKQHSGISTEALRRLIREDPEAATPKLPSAAYSSSPIFHHNIGVDQYTRVTSPLRRYSDLLNHWQIHAQLRYEATLSGKDASKNPRSLPFTAGDIDGHLLRNTGREFDHRKLSQFDDFHWKMQAMFRAFYFKEAELPETVQVRVTTAYKAHSETASGYIRGIIAPFDFICVFQKSPEGFLDEAKQGDIFPARIVRVNPNLWGDLEVQALGPARHAIGTI